MLRLLASIILLASLMTSIKVINIEEIANDYYRFVLMPHSYSYFFKAADFGALDTGDSFLTAAESHSGTGEVLLMKLDKKSFNIKDAKLLDFETDERVNFVSAVQLNRYTLTVFVNSSQVHLKLLDRQLNVLDSRVVEFDDIRVRVDDIVLVEKYHNRFYLVIFSDDLASRKIILDVLELEIVSDRLHLVSAVSYNPDVPTDCVVFDRVLSAKFSFKLKKLIIVTTCRIFVIPADLDSEGLVFNRKYSGADFLDDKIVVVKDNILSVYKFDSYIKTTASVKLLNELINPFSNYTLYSLADFPLSEEEFNQTFLRFYSKQEVKNYYKELALQLFKETGETEFKFFDKVAVLYTSEEIEESKHTFVNITVCRFDEKKQKKVCKRKEVLKYDVIVNKTARLITNSSIYVNKIMLANVTVSIKQKHIEKFVKTKVALFDREKLRLLDVAVLNNKIYVLAFLRNEDREGGESVLFVFDNNLKLIDSARLSHYFKYIDATDTHLILYDWIYTILILKPEQLNYLDKYLVNYKVKEPESMFVTIFDYSTLKEEDEIRFTLKSS